MSRLYKIERVVYPELANAFTGELFTPRAHNHYEANDGKPVAPHVDTPRPTVRQRIENLLNRGVDPLAHYVGTEGVDLDVPDDPEHPLTSSEMNYLDAVAESLAEAAPLPDEGLPRTEPPPPPSAASPSPQPPQAPQGPVSSPAPGPGAAPVPTR